jgi:hypothetical protein
VNSQGQLPVNFGQQQVIAQAAPRTHNMRGKLHLNQALNCDIFSIEQTSGQIDGTTIKRLIPNAQFRK